MTDFESSPQEAMRALHEVLRRLVQAMTRQIFATPRQMQMDVGTAISLLNQTEDFPRRSLLSRALPDLLRELGNRRPDLYRYIVSIEDAAREIEQELERPEWE